MTPFRAVRDLLVWTMLWKEFLQLSRDRLTFAMILGIPTMQIIIFGFLVQTQVRHLPTVVWDQSRTTASRELAQRLENTQNFTITGQVASSTELDQAIASGQAQAALVIPVEYARDLKRGRTASAQLLIDAQDPMTATSAIAGGQAASLATAIALRPTAPPPPVDLRVRPRYNPALRDAVFIVPGLIGVVLTITLVLVTAMSLVKEREQGTLEQLIVTPISRQTVIVGKIAPFVIIGLVQTTVVLVLGKLIFDIPFRGSLVLLYACTLAFMIAMLGLGILMSTVARTQGQALQMGMLILFPSILLSGFIFPLAAMPLVARVAGMLFPVTHYLTILRGILLKGVGLDALWPSALTLVVFAVALVTLSVTRFAKTLE